MNKKNFKNFIALAALMSCCMLHAGMQDSMPKAQIIPGRAGHGVQSIEGKYFQRLIRLSGDNQGKVTDFTQEVVDLKSETQKRVIQFWFDTLIKDIEKLKNGMDIQDQVDHLKSSIQMFRDALENLPLSERKRDAVHIFNLNVSMHSEIHFEKIVLKEPEVSKKRVKRPGEAGGGIQTEEGKYFQRLVRLPEDENALVVNDFVQEIANLPRPRMEKVINFWFIALTNGLEEIKNASTPLLRQDARKRFFDTLAKVNTIKQKLLDNNRTKSVFAKSSNKWNKEHSEAIEEVEQ